ncbi:hypothetical protein [Pseudophaeobacter arcticus]|uniref:hypothetical protein n=1 Tax=Pseudophaeobacter arcticus TaxID=385492 RepID=UPI00248FE520|nr:hypothetical protein [Pseudophaeobacter arcticus]
MNFTDICVTAIYGHDLPGPSYVSFICAQRAFVLEGSPPQAPVAPNACAFCDRANVSFVRVAVFVKL